MSVRPLHLSLVFAVSAGAQWLPVDQYKPTRVFSRDMLAAHNQIRARVDVPPLIWSASLAARARDWASHLVRQARFEAPVARTCSLHCGSVGFHSGRQAFSRGDVR